MLHLACQVSLIHPVLAFGGPATTLEALFLILFWKVKPMMVLRPFLPVRVCSKETPHVISLDRGQGIPSFRAGRALQSIRAQSKLLEALILLAKGRHCVPLECHRIPTNQQYQRLALAGRAFEHVALPKRLSEEPGQPMLGLTMFPVASRSKPSCIGSGFAQLRNGKARGVADRRSKQHQLLRGDALCKIAMHVVVHDHV